MKLKSKWYNSFFAGAMFAAIYLMIITLIGTAQDERVDNYVPFGVDCVDGKDVLFAGHKKPTFMCTEYQRNSIPLRSE